MLPRNSPATTRAPTGLVVSDPDFMWPYQATEPSSCRTETAFQSSLPKVQLRSKLPSALNTMVPDAEATISSWPVCIMFQLSGQMEMSSPWWL